MFVRTKKNKSGTFCVQVINKTGGSYRVAKIIGSSADFDEIAIFKQEATAVISTFNGQQIFAFNQLDLINLSGH
jgi:hypothetical protein